MAIDQAKKLIEELQNDETKRAAFMAAPADFLAAGGYDCTESEVKEAYTMNRELDDEELNTLAGGKGCSSLWFGADGNGNCAENFYDEPCAATVEKGSWCGTNDYCERSYERYHCFGPAKK